LKFLPLLVEQLLLFHFQLLQLVIARLHLLSSFPESSLCLSQLLGQLVRLLLFEGQLPPHLFVLDLGKGFMLDLLVEILLPLIEFLLELVVELGDHGKFCLD
jgi:hypothetical protein